MTATMALRIATPTVVEVDTGRCIHLRAEDATGSFGIQPHHAAFVTVLVPTVLSWRELGGAEHFVAVRGGVLAVDPVHGVSVVTREAIAEDDFEQLQRAVLARLRADEAAERQERRQTSRLHISFIRQLSRMLRGAGLRGQPGVAARGPRPSELAGGEG